jgi:hypothetical protein
MNPPPNWMRMLRGSSLAIAPATLKSEAAGCGPAGQGGLGRNTGQQDDMFGRWPDSLLSHTRPVELIRAPARPRTAADVSAAAGLLEDDLRVRVSG